MAKSEVSRSRIHKATTREAILTAAEQGFAEKGFAGATVREICARAHVNSGLMSYYFASKEALFAEVIERRLGEMLERFDAHVTAIVVERGEAFCIEDAFFAYASFLLNLAADTKSGWAYYIRLLAQSAAFYEIRPVGDLLDRFKPMVGGFQSLLRRALPDLEEEEIARAAFYMESAITTVLVSGDLIQKRLPRLATSDVEAIARDMAKFFASRMG